MSEFALATTADLPLLPDFRILVRTFREHHPDVPIVCVGKSDFKTECDNLGVIHVAYDKPWSFYREIVHLKALAITEALRIAPSVLFCDADIIFLSKYTPKPGTWISPHYMKPSACAAYGKYNCGYLSTDDPKLAPWWVDHVMNHPNEFGEQQALDHFGGAFKVNEFDEGHNVGWWRLHHADDPVAFAASLQMDGYLYCCGHRVVTIHTHLFRYANAKSNQSQDITPVTGFNKLLEKRLGDLKRLMEEKSVSAERANEVVGGRLSDDTYNRVVLDCVASQLSGLWTNCNEAAMMASIDKRVSSMFDVAERCAKEAKRRGVI